MFMVIAKSYIPSEKTESQDVTLKFPIQVKVLENSK